MKNAIITTSWDDGHPLDFRLMKLLKNNKIPGTFYIPLNNQENPVMDKESIKELSKNFEIGGHTLNHKILTQLNDEEIHYEISKGKEELEKICGEIHSFAYPRGQYNKKIMSEVSNVGFQGARTAELFHTKINDLFEYHPTIQAVNRTILSKGKQLIKSDSQSMMLYLLKHGIVKNNWYQIAKNSLDYVLKHGGIWHLWGHSWEINHYNDWNLLNSILQYAYTRGVEYNAEFLTNKEILQKNNFHN
jgi:peptidoglycan-N-acetylglucosamine deacetylase